MGHWVVNQGNHQFNTSGLEELQKLAARGDLDAGDLIQPDGAEDWLYACEIPELGKMKSSVLDDEEDRELAGNRSGSGSMLWAGIWGLGLIVGAGASLWFAVPFMDRLEADDQRISGEEGSLGYEQLISLQSQSIFAEPDANSAVVGTVAKDDRVDLLAKRGQFYKVGLAGGKSGWASVRDMLPGYRLGGEDANDKYDPLYNPDQYTRVVSASWLGVEGEDTAIFNVMVENISDYAMDDVKLSVVIKDSAGAELSREEFSVAGPFEAKESTMVGTLNPPEEEIKAAEKAGEEPPAGVFMAAQAFGKLVEPLPPEEQDQMYNRWLDGIELGVQEEFVGATVRVEELRAIRESGK